MVFLSKVSNSVFKINCCLFGDGGGGGGHNNKTQAGIVQS